MTFSATLNASAFANAALCVSDDKFRHYLHGVQVEPCKEGGALMIATDGSILVVIHDPEAKITGSSIVNLPKQLISACGKRGGDVLTIENDTAHVGGLSANAVLIDTDYPDWRRVLPSSDVNEPCKGTFNPAFIARIGKAVNGVARNGRVRLSGDCPTAPHWVHGSDVNAVGVIMPLRDCATPEKPSFIA